MRKLRLRQGRKHAQRLRGGTEIQIQVFTRLPTMSDICSSILQFYLSTDLRTRTGGPETGLCAVWCPCQGTGSFVARACVDRSSGCEGRLLLKSQTGAHAACRAAAAGTDGSGHWDGSTWLSFKHRIISFSGSSPARWGLGAGGRGRTTRAWPGSFHFSGYLQCARSGVRF